LEKIKNLAISYYNLGLEEEHFQYTKQALLWFKKGYDIAAKHFQKNNKLVQKL